MEENVLRELVKSKKILKKKFESIKLGEAETFNKLENTFKPLTEPLNKLVKLSSENSLKPKAFTDEEAEYEYNTKKKRREKNIIASTPKEKTLTQSYFHLTPKASEMNEDNNKYNEKEDDMNNEAFYSQSSDLEFDLPDLNKDNEIDTVFGPYKNQNGDWKFGNLDFKLSDEKIIIGNQHWARTPGLYELLFYQRPKNYDASELDIYKKILVDSNAHRRNNDPNKQLKGNRGYKYKHIISKLFATTHVGKGLMEVNLHKPNYIYWDDPNELVDRLKLLIASQHSGNNNHTNEIISIVEELREANIIE